MISKANQDIVQLLGAILGNTKDIDKITIHCCPISRVVTITSKERAWTASTRMPMLDAGAQA